MTDTYPQDDDVSDEADERWLALSSPPPLTPEEDFDAFFEQWQAAEEEAHMQQVLVALENQGRAHDTPAKLAP